MKSCIKCNLKKPYTDFHSDKTKADGLVSTCKQCKSEYRKSYYSKNQDAAKSYAKDWVDKNKDRHKATCADWRSKNRDQHLAYRRARHKNSYANNHEYRLQAIMRAYLRKCIKSAGLKKESKTVTCLGYDHYALRQRIEVNFKKGMSWENYGEWEIDHKIPIAVFMRRGVTCPKVINMLSNLQPLWRDENRSKGARYIG